MLRNLAFAILAAITMTLGNLAACWQNNVRRILAYSSIAQAGYIAIGFVVSFLVAYVVIRQFLVIVAKFGLRPFGWYRIAAGLVLFAWIALR